MDFQRHIIDLPDNVFPALYESVKWEAFPKGRELVVLHSSDTESIPLVRTTAIYHTPSQPFSKIHHTIIDEIRKASGIPNLQFNNGMLEIYDSRYTTMKFHTDQAFDLEPDSYICLFSCYERGADSHPRVLTVKNKETGEEFEVQLLHHSAVIFSTDANRRHLHKIEGKGLPRDHDNRWMGFTMRLSKTFVKFVDDVPYLMSDKAELVELTLATDAERGAFYKFKGSENKAIDFEYPEISYTISPSDRMPPPSNHPIPQTTASTPPTASHNPPRSN